MSARGPALITVIYAAFAATWIVASGSALYWVVPDPVLQSRLEIAKGLAFVAVSSGLLFLMLRAWQPAGPAEASVSTPLTTNAAYPAGSSARVLLVLLMLALTVPLVGFAVFALHARQAEQETLTNLRAIAGFKAGQIENWLAERQGDANVLVDSEGFMQGVDAFQRTGDPRERRFVRDRLAAMQKAYSYESVELVDVSARLLLSLGSPEPVSDKDREQVREAIAAGKVRMVDLHLDPDGRRKMHFIAPLISRSGPRPKRLGAILLHVNPEMFLFPLVQSWPSATESGETLLVRRDGDSVLYLSESRQGNGSAMSLWLPLDLPQLPAAAAVRGKTAGTLSGINYGGVAVLSAWSPVTGTDWMLIANLDRDEALQPARATALWSAGIALFAVVVVAIALMQLLIQQRRTRQLALQLQADQLFRHFYELPFVGMVITSAETGEWLHFNDQLCAICGYTREELHTRGWQELVHAEDAGKLTAHMRDVLDGTSEGFTTEVRFNHKDGSPRFTNVNVKCVLRPNGTPEYLVAMSQDITERKAAETRILELNRLYLTLSRCNMAITRCKNEQQLFMEICRAAVESGGVRLAWVGMADPKTRRVFPVARYGASVEYLDDIHISVDADDPHGRGPTGTAIREGEPFWCQDFQKDPRTAPWRDQGARYGWYGSASLPLRCGGRVIGALTLYMGEPRAFDRQTRDLLTEIAADISYGLDKFASDTARREAEQSYRLLFENSLDAILLTAPDGGILAANPAASRIFGFSEAELVAAGREAIVDVADPRLKPALEERERTGQFSGELTMVRKNGEKFPAELSSTVFADRAGVMRTSMIIHDITERKRAYERLAYLTQHDALTNLPNRLLLTDRLRMALAQAQRSGRRLALMFMDLDRFKNVNDSLGHEAGDRLLVQVAERLKTCVRATDTVSRQGGDEFVVLLSEIDGVQDAARVAQKLLESVAEPFRLDAHEMVISISVGIACFPENGRDADTLLRNADAAMYAAKDGGRNRHQFYSGDMNARAQERLVLENDLRRAMEWQQLVVIYQRQVNLATGDVIGFEALLRWHHPALGKVSPAQFVPIAESSGLIVPIGSWVLETACRQQAVWVAEGLIKGPMAVNVSAYQFRQAEFVELVAAILARTGLQPQYLELEVTESVVMHAVEEVVAKLKRLDDLGVKLAIDDFGTGYSSLSYLKQFPIHRLKIDQSFTRGLPQDRGSSAIAHAVISMGHSLGLNVLAEGVETEAQQEHLQTLGCDAGQGYLYAMPLSADDCTAYLRQRAPAA